MRMFKKLCACVLLLLLLLATVSCKNSSNGGTGTLVEHLEWGMTQPEAAAALGDAAWEDFGEVNGEKVYLVTYGGELLGTSAFRARGQEGCVELRFARPVLEEGDPEAWVLSGVYFNIDSAQQPFTSACALLNKSYGEASVSEMAGLKTAGWMLPWNTNKQTPRVLLAAAVLSSKDISEGSLSAFCAKYAVEGLYPYDAAACETTWKTWQAAAQAQNTSYGPVIQLSEQDGTISVACRGKAAAFVPYLEEQYAP